MLPEETEETYSRAPPPECPIPTIFFDEDGYNALRTVMRSDAFRFQSYAGTRYRGTKRQ